MPVWLLSLSCIAPLTFQGKHNQMKAKSRIGDMSWSISMTPACILGRQLKTPKQAQAGAIVLSGSCPNDPSAG